MYAHTNILSKRERLFEKASQIKTDIEFVVFRSMNESTPFSIFRNKLLHIEKRIMNEHHWRQYPIQLRKRNIVFLIDYVCVTEINLLSLCGRCFCQNH